MSPDPKYEIGKERGAGTEGYAPLLLWQFWGLFFAFVLSAFPSTTDSVFTLTLESVILSFIVMPLVCIIVLLVFQRYVRRRYQTDFSNQRFEEIVNQAKAKMGFTPEFEIWLLPEWKHILIENAGFLHTTLVVSEPTIQDILDKPEEGEVVLASAIQRLRLIRVINTWGSIGLLILLMVILTIFRLTASIVGAGWVVMVWVVFVIFPSPMVMRRNREESNDVERVYGIHPNVASLIVFRGSQPTDREVNKYITREFGVFEDSVQYRKALVIYLISVLASVLVGIPLFNFLLGISNPLFAMVEGIRATISLLTSIVVFVGLYFGLVFYFIPELK